MLVRLAVSPRLSAQVWYDAVDSVREQAVVVMSVLPGSAEEELEARPRRYM